MRLAVTAVIVLISVACHPTRPVIDTGTKPPTVDGTIAGTVRVADSGTPLVSRRVSAVHTETGMRYEASTNNAGAYSMKVPPGTFRLSVELRSGESLAKEPGETHVNASDVDAQRDFAVTAP